MPGHHHHGWLSVNPNHFFDQFIEFKKDILGRIGGGVNLIFGFQRIFFVMFFGCNANILLK